MDSLCRSAAIAAMGLGALVAQAHATTLPYSTGFEAAQGYTNGSQLATNANWTGDGQDTSGWLVTNSSVGGSGASSGSQWVLASSPTASAARFQWTVTPVTDFSTYSTIKASSDVKLVTPASGTLNRSTLAGIQMYDASISRICQLLLIVDSQNSYGAGAGQMILELGFGDGTGFAYNLGVANALNQYVNLGLEANFQTGVVTGYLNGVALPNTGPIGAHTDFHDFDLIAGSLLSTSGGVRARAGFDNYSIEHVPAPSAMALLGVSGLLAARRRRA